MRAREKHAALLIENYYKRYKEVCTICTQTEPSYKERSTVIQVWVCVVTCLDATSVRKKKKKRPVNQVELLCNRKTFCDTKQGSPFSRCCMGGTCGVGIRLGFVEVLKPWTR